MDRFNWVGLAGLVWQDLTKYIGVVLYAPSGNITGWHFSASYPLSPNFFVHPLTPRTPHSVYIFLSAKEPTTPQSLIFRDFPIDFMISLGLNRLCVVIFISKGVREE